jgi:prepilin-type N-terminal cleavage/methylation domain-containing protein
MRLQRHTGFTLIELLVVMAIIGILSAVVLTSLNGARQKGRDARRISDVKQIQLALELFYDSTGEYPVSIGTPGSSVLETNGYIATLPTDPSNSAAYSYAPYQVDDADASNDGLCIGYHIGGSLESGITHTALQTDADKTTLALNPGETTATNFELCAEVGASPDFHGSDQGKCNDTTDIGSACFDARS